jgi:DNA polymerase-3 subunit alpha
MIFQEQIMKRMKALAGFTSAESDSARSAIGKKNREKLQNMKDDFVKNSSSGFIDVEMDDGTTMTVNINSKFKCADGALRTANEAMSGGFEVISLA